MPKQRPTLKLLKRLEGCRRIAVLGIGSDLRGDDAAGMLIVRQLGLMVSKSSFRHLQYEGFEGSNAPENATGYISRFKPTHIIVVDAADLSISVGEYREIDPEEISDISFSTHTLPLKIITDYLKQATEADISIIGMQPGLLDFGKPPTAPMVRGIRELSGELYEFMQRCDQDLGL